MSIKNYKLWQDEETLQYLYWEKEMSHKEISERVGCSSTTVNKWKKRHNIGSRDYGIEKAHEARRVNYATFGLSKRVGYEIWESTYKGDSNRVLVHRLMSVAKFGYKRTVENVVHHKSEVKWDNRMSNIEIMSMKEHMQHHSERRHRNELGRYTEKGAKT